MRTILALCLALACVAAAGAVERTGLVTMGGKPVTLLGSPVKVGEPAPDFTAVDGKWNPVKLSDFKGKVVILSGVPSLDTRVCSAETREFNKRASALGKDVQIVTLSEDLPFAQSRFCKAENIGSLLVLSDTVDREFGLKYGILIKGRSLLSRAVFVVGKNGKIVYEQLVSELAHEPDYDRALAAARRAAGS